MAKADIPALKEPSGPLRTDGKRPDGVTLLPWKKGKCITWDVTVSDSLAQSYVHDTSQTPCTDDHRDSALLYQRLPVFILTLQCGRCFGYLRPHNPRGRNVAVPAFVLVFSPRDLYYQRH